MGSKPKFGYWEHRGIGQPIRFMLAYLNVDYEEKRYKLDDRDSWFVKDKFNLGLDFPNIPYWIYGDVKLTETQAIIKYIADTHGSAYNLAPQDFKLDCKAEMISSVILTLWWAMIRLCCDYTDELRKSFDEMASKKLEQLSKCLGNNPFILGQEISYVDFILYEFLYHTLKFEPTSLKNLPNLVQFKKRFEEIPAIKAYIASPKYVEKPCINPKAKYTKINE